MTVNIRALDKFNFLVSEFTITADINTIRRIINMLDKFFKVSISVLKG